MSRNVFATILLLLFVQNGFAQKSRVERPNVLWLSVEDIGPHLGCYGDPVAQTPNLDALANQGVVYDFAWSNYPVCAPARTTIITGVYASTMAAGHMRCDIPLDKDLKMFPHYLREAGYYCTNKSKEDYNVRTSEQVWDQSNGKAHYRNRPENSNPFFAVINHTGTHESKIRKRPHELVTDPASIHVPPYHPDVPEVRRDWAQYYDNIATMDQWVGKQLALLKENNLEDDTIVVFFGDHGSGMPRHKRYAGHSGMHVPLIVFVPEKLRHLAPENFQPGVRSKRLVSFVDFAPTMLSLAGIQPPAEMQGRAFLGEYTQPGPDHLLGFRSRMDERIDCSRSVSDGRYVYIRNYMPHLPHGQFINYQQQTPTTAIWNQMYRDGKLNEVQSYFWGPKDFEELYDLQADPHETVNLVKGLESELPQETKAILQRLRRPLDSFQHSSDIELLSESQTAYLPANESAFDLKNKLVLTNAIAQGAAGMTSRHRTKLELNLQVLAAPFKTADEIARRHWASVGVLIRGQEAVENQKDRLVELLNDDVFTVRVNIAETLATYGGKDDMKPAMEALLKVADMTKSDYYSAIWALNAIDRLGERAEPYKAQIAELPRKPEGMKRGNDYVQRLIENIVNKLNE